MDDYLRLQGIRKSFGSFQALADIDLTIAPGRVRLLPRPFGLRQDHPAAHHRRPGDADRRRASSRPGATSRSCRRPSATTASSSSRTRSFPTSRSPTTSPTAWSTARWPRATIAARVEELLKLVGLPGSGAKFPAQLSGGQQQRIALARALATSPGLLLLDEPLSALDAIVRVHLRQEIRSLQRKLGVTTIMVTHDQEEALSVADRIVVMNQGVIEQVGTPMEVYRDPATPFVADFVGKINVLTGRLHPGRDLRIGASRFACERDTDTEREVKVYLRPEDVLARPIAPGDANVFDGAIDKIEFLGSYCLVRVNAEAMGSEPITVYLSLNYLAEQGLEVGSRLPLKVLPERMRFF